MDEHPIDIPQGDLTLWMNTDATVEAEGFTFVFATDEWYEGDMQCGGVVPGDECDGVTVISVYGETWASTFPDPIFPGDDKIAGDSFTHIHRNDRPISAYCNDVELERGSFRCEVVITADEPSSFATKYVAYRIKILAPGQWGFMMEDDATIYGPKDTNPIPYYAAGGSTGTAAPDLGGGGPPGPRVYNRHGQIVPGSSRGMHPDLLGQVDVNEGILGRG